MSAITLSREMANLVEAFGLGWDRLEWLTINAMKSAFLPFDERLALMTDVIKPGYAALQLAANDDEPGSKSPARRTTILAELDRYENASLTLSFTSCGRVLRLADGLLGATLGLVHLAFGLEVLVVRGLAGRFLHGTLRLVPGAFRAIVLACHRWPPSVRVPTWFPRRHRDPAETAVRSGATQEEHDRGDHEHDHQDGADETQSHGCKHGPLLSPMMSCSPYPRQDGAGNEGALRREEVGSPGARSMNASRSFISVMRNTRCTRSGPLTSSSSRPSRRLRASADTIEPQPGRVDELHVAEIDDDPFRPLCFRVRERRLRRTDGLEVEHAGERQDDRRIRRDPGRSGEVHDRSDSPAVVRATDKRLQNLAGSYPATPGTCRYPCGWRTRDTHVRNAGNRWIPTLPTS